MLKEFCCILAVIIVNASTIHRNEVETKVNQESQIESISDKKILLLYHDENKQLHQLTSMIEKKMQVSAYEIDCDEVPDAKGYDIILLGDIAQQDHPSKEMMSFLSWYDLKGRDVSAYWMSAFHDKAYEEQLRKLIQNGTYFSGLGINDDEIGAEKEVDSLMNGWLTSCYSPVSKLPSF